MEPLPMDLPCQGGGSVSSPMLRARTCDEILLGGILTLALKRGGVPSTRSMMPSTRGARDF